MQHSSVFYSTADLPLEFYTNQSKFKQNTIQSAILNKHIFMPKMVPFLHKCESMWKTTEKQLFPQARWYSRQLWDECINPLFLLH